MLARYGVKFAMQNSNLASKQFQSSVQAKIVVVNNQEVKLRGYEYQAIEYLQTRLDISQFKFKPSEMSVVSFRYDDDEHVYYPDMYDETRRCFIEVKSLHTLPRLLVQKKSQAVLNNGYNFQLLVMDEKECLLDRIWNSGDKFDLVEVCKKFGLSPKANMEFHQQDRVKAKVYLEERIKAKSLCDYGCGQLAKFITSISHEKICCSEKSGKCPELGKKRWRNRVRTLETTKEVLVRLEVGSTCDYGCGREAKYLLSLSTKDSLCCERVSGKCPAVIARRWKNRKRHVNNI